MAEEDNGALCSLSLEFCTKSEPTKLQLVSVCGHSAIKPIMSATNDLEYQNNQCKLRITLTALLIKIYSRYEFGNPASSPALSKVKDIIFSSRLDELQESKGILRDKLMKNLASVFQTLESKLCALAQTRQTFHFLKQCQTQVVKAFNCVPFFCDIFVTSCIEEQPDILADQTNIKKFMHSKFGIDIVLVDDLQHINDPQEDHQLILLSVNQSEHSEARMWYRLSINQTGSQLLRPPAMQKMESLESPRKIRSATVDEMQREECSSLDNQVNEEKQMREITLTPINKKLEYLPEEVKTIENYLLLTIEDSFSSSFKDSRSKRKIRRSSGHLSNRKSDVVPFDMKLEQADTNTQRGVAKDETVKAGGTRKSNKERDTQTCSIWSLLCCS